MEPKQNCLSAHTAHGLPPPVCHMEMPPEMQARLRFVALTCHLGKP